MSKEPQVQIDEFPFPGETPTASLVNAPQEHSITAPERPSGAMSLMQMAIENGAGIDVIERLKALYDQERNRFAENEFNAAMSRVQASLTAIAPNLNNPQTSSKYAGYAAIDKVLRPVYSREGFSLSFNTEEATVPEYIRITCDVSHKAGFTKHYKVLMPIVTTGIKGNAMMTPTHATASAMSYGKRYLVNFAFNLAIGESGDDTDGNGTTHSMMGLPVALDAIKNAPDNSALQKIFGEAANMALKAKDNTALDALKAARDAKIAEWRKGSK